MILLDTNAVLYVLAGHPRARALAMHRPPFGISPITLLELRFLEESGKGRFSSTRPLGAVRHDARFRLDDPTLSELVERSLELSWTRDPFDCLLVAHALCRGWPFATSDTVILENLPARAVIGL